MGEGIGVQEEEKGAEQESSRKLPSSLGHGCREGKLTNQGSLATDHGSYNHGLYTWKLLSAAGRVHRGRACQGEAAPHPGPGHPAPAGPGLAPSSAEPSPQASGS